MDDGHQGGGHPLIVLHPYLSQGGVVGGIKGYLDHQCVVEYQILFLQSWL